MKLIIALLTITGSIFCTSCSKSEQVISQTATLEAASGSFDFTETYCDGGEDEDPQPILAGNVNGPAPLNLPLYRACVKVQTLGGSQVTITGTDSVGHYYFNTLSNGSYKLVVSYPGFTSDTTAFTVSGSPQTINVVLN